jgi:hypothetical protein
MESAFLPLFLCNAVNFEKEVKRPRIRSSSSCNAGAKAVFGLSVKAKPLREKEKRDAFHEQATPHQNNRIE